MQERKLGFIFLLTLTLAVNFTNCAAQQCNNTHLQFQSEYSLGKQDQLNRTFTLLQKSFPTIQPIRYNQSSSNYTINNTIPTFYYRDTKQKAQVVDNDTIVITGGRLQIDFKFEWAVEGVSGKRNGTGRGIQCINVGFGLSEVLVFGKQIIIDKGFYVYNLTEAYDLIGYDKWMVTRVDPQETKPQDIEVLTLMINDLPDKKSLKAVVFNHINQQYIKYLNESLHDEMYHPTENFDYIWHRRSDQQLLVANYSMKPTGVSVTKDGIIMTYTSVLKDFNEWKCGNYSIPAQPLDPKKYGGLQEIISMTVLENTVRYARDKTFFDTALNRRNWESRFNQFFAGDFYEVIPKISEHFAANEVLTGTCRATESGYQFKKSGHDTLNVTIGYDCFIQIQQTRIAQLKMNLQMQVQGIAGPKQMDFIILDFTYKELQFLKVGDYSVQNTQLAQAMVRHSLNRLKHERVFGSGWNLTTRDSPHFQVEEGYVLIYDSSHVQQQQSE